MKIEEALNIDERFEKLEVYIKLLEDRIRLLELAEESTVSSPIIENLQSRYFNQP